MTQTVYPPLDTLKPIAQNVWIVDSGPLPVLGMPLPVRMTIIRTGSGDLILHSPTQFSFALKAQLDGLGSVAHLLAPNTAHWSFMKEWQAHVPHAVCWGVPGLSARPAVQKSGLRIDEVFTDGVPDAWNGEIEIVLVRGKGLIEAALFHRPSRTLVLTDLIVNLEPEKLPLPMRLGARLVGALAPAGKAPSYARAAIKAGGAQARAAASRLVELDPERVIFAHGRCHEHEAAKHLQTSLDWLLPH